MLFLECGRCPYFSHEVKELVKYYLNHPLERKEIAQKGHNEALAKHTYVHRIEELLKAIGGIRGGGQQHV